jgi:hypothetical protein
MNMQALGAAAHAAPYLTGLGRSEAIRGQKKLMETRQRRNGADPAVDIVAHDETDCVAHDWQFNCLSTSSRN